MNKTKKNSTKKKTRGGMLSRLKKKSVRKSNGVVPINYNDEEELSQIFNLLRVSSRRPVNIATHPLLYYDWDRKAKAKLLIELYHSTKNKHEKKEIKEILDRLRIQHFSDISNFSMKELKEYCDELYLSMMPDELNFRRRFLDENHSFPEDINDPDTILGRVFHIFWNRGTEEYKPTLLMEKIKYEIDNVRITIPQHYQLTGDEWEEEYQKAYYENIYKALTRPITRGGKKMKKTIKKNNLLR
jgi:hypothetical protein